MRIVLSHFQILRRAVNTMPALAVALLAGCAGFTPDGGMDAVSAMVRERTGQNLVRIDNEEDAVLVQAAIDAMIARPLTADNAVRIALMNNRGLQASLAELGISEADLVQAGRLRNPGLHLGSMRAVENEIEGTVMFDLLGLLTMPARIEIERRRFEQVQRQAALEAVRVAARTRQAYYTAIAADESARYMEQIRLAADAGADLGNRMAKAGNWNALAQSRQQVFYAEAVAQHARYQHAAVAAREELVRQLGLWGSGVQLKLPQRLPDLPGMPKKVADLERKAMAERSDVMRARRETLLLASTLGLVPAREKSLARVEQPRPQVEQAPAEAMTRTGFIDNYLAKREQRKETPVSRVQISAPQISAPASSSDGTADAEARLAGNRLDLQSAEFEMEARAGARGLVRVAGLAGSVEAGYQFMRESDQPFAGGPEFSLELPIFDWGDARNAKAQAQYMQAVHRTADIALRARSEVREAYAAYRTAYDVAKHYRDEIVPLRKKISDEMLQRYNGMLNSVFDLIADAKDQVGSVNAAIEALRDFWVADSNLQLVLNGGSGTAVTLAGKPLTGEGSGGH